MSSAVHPAAAAAAATDSVPTLPVDLLAQFDVPGPRYTSYPTADRFTEAFGAADLVRALQARTLGGIGQPLSVYVHIPFCESLCYYCACNKVITRHHERASAYLAALATEIELVARSLERDARVCQLHLGGGSPTFLSDDELARLMADLQRHLRLAPGAEVSIEVDPRTADAARLAAWRELGINRLSFGVQDFDPTVQKAVHRVQSTEQVQALVAEARALGYASINADLIYGLPMQTRASFDRTIAQMAALRPDRIALYAYAHLPSRFKPQRRIHEADLPPAGARVDMLAAAIAGFIGQGYAYIGMDHFALATDALAVARRQGRLHRNFQGYSTLPDCDLIGLGVSAIGKVGATYSQNAKTLPEYYDALAQGSLPVVRGLALTRDDVIRRSAIMALMCQGRLEWEPLSQAHLIDAPQYFAREIERLRPLQDNGLVLLEPGAVQVTAKGWFLVRAVAMVFDKYVQADEARQRFSRII